MSGPFREGGPVPPCEACAKRERRRLRWDALRPRAVTVAMCAAGVLVIWFIGAAIQRKSAEVDRENQDYYVCRAECMAEHGVTATSRDAGRCFCALDPGDGWSESPSHWVEVHP